MEYQDIFTGEVANDNSQNSNKLEEFVSESEEYQDIYQDTYYL
jgi:translation elongation factor P/translation initiation factor 5A